MFCFCFRFRDMMFAFSSPGGMLWAAGGFITNWHLFLRNLTASAGHSDLAWPEVRIDNSMREIRNRSNAHGRADKLSGAIAPVPASILQ